jgi:YidC/Oxa1 family membrane protein insertase
MSDRFRTIIAFLLIIGILLVWSLLSRPKTEPEVIQPEIADTIPPVPEKKEELPVTMPGDADTIVVVRSRFRIVLSTAGASVKEFYLKEYDVNVVPEEKHLFVTQINNGEIVNFKYSVQGDSVIFTHRSGMVEVRKVYHFDDPNGFRLFNSVSDNISQKISLKSGIRVTEVKNRGEDLRHFDVYVKDEKVNSLKKKIKDEYSYTGEVDWFALRSKYFLLVMHNHGVIDGIDLYKLPKESEGDKQTACANETHYSAAFGCFYMMRGGGDRYGAEIRGTHDINVSVRLLPIKYSELVKFNEGYENIVSGGLLGPISRFFLVIFNFFYSIFRNYGFAIIFFAIIIKAIFFPLSRQMISSQHKMQMIQPELKKLQKKYKNDPQRLNQEMMQLYKAYKVNPFSGCFPLLIQMPIFFALYQTLITSIEFRQANFIFWITDLSLKDPYYVLPITMGVMMLVQSLLTTIDPRQRFMVIIMPIFMVYIFLNFPSGLQLYWFSYNILTLIEHVITKRGGIK